MIPYITIVATSRNDNHGDAMMKRMRMFVNGLISQSNKYQLPIELIIVEWNPPANTALLNTVLPKPSSTDYLSLRYIVVPNEVHSKFRFAKELPLYQMIAKNVGIRRAKAEFILCTNVDVLFSDGLMKELSEKKLDKKFFYRANRCDVPSSINEEWSFEEQLVFCQHNIIRRLGFDRDLMNMGRMPGWVYKWPSLAKAINCVKPYLRKRYFTDAELKLLLLDTKACGDFTMMHKSAWATIMGYPELDLYSIHIDSMGIISAAASGYKQYIFSPSNCIYHIDHYNGWEAMTAIEKVRFINNKPGIGWDIVSETAMQLFNEGKGYSFNEETWGFDGQEFQEVVFNAFE